MTHTMQSCLMLMLQKHINEALLEDINGDTNNDALIKYHVQPYPFPLTFQVDLTNTNVTTDMNKTSVAPPQQNIIDKLKHYLFTRDHGHHH